MVFQMRVWDIQRSGCGMCIKCLTVLISLLSLQRWNIKEWVKTGFVPEKPGKTTAWPGCKYRFFPAGEEHSLAEPTKERQINKFHLTKNNVYVNE